MEQTALRAPRTTGATGWGAPGPGQTFERARSTKVGDGLVPVRTAIRIGTEAEPLFMGLWVPESGMRDFRDAHRCLLPVAISGRQELLDLLY
jgi:hypothetical protein